MTAGHAVHQTLTPVHTANHAAGVQLLLALWLGMAFVSLCSVVPPIYRAARTTLRDRQARRLGTPQPAPADPDPMPGTRRAPVSGGRR